jgi:hypothetical protein
MPDWWLTKDGDVDCLALYKRHYPITRKRGPRRIPLFVGPGEKRVLRTEDGRAVFVWRRFTDDCIDERTGERQAGVNCAMFRNESAGLSSDLIRQADAIADFLWLDRRHYTYVDPARVASGLPGACFLAAGWRYVRIRGHRARTKSGLLILERV